MINYCMIGVSDVNKAGEFYDAVLEIIGATPIHKTESQRFYGQDRTKPLFAICLPFNGDNASAGNGTMVALGTDTKEKVHAAYAKAIELGANCEGEPGPRGQYGEFAYFRDADGNKIAISCTPRTSA